ncbi:MAG: monovalent cation/H(+) antiporter subunit G [bacterium]|nr:monovalent cation/H(+) antiporter subunit G [bacterium]
MIEWIVALVAMGFILTGVIIATIATFGLHRFDYILNRMHAAAILDTSVILLVLFGSILFSVLVYPTTAEKVVSTLKILLVLLFLWYSSPVSSHLIVRLELLLHHRKVKTWTDKEV